MVRPLCPMVSMLLAGCYVSIREVRYSFKRAVAVENPLVVWLSEPKPLAACEFGADLTPNDIPSILQTACSWSR